VIGVDTFFIAVFLLRASVQQYAWGKPGLQSEVAKLCQSGDKQFKLDESSPYAEARCFIVFNSSR